MSTHQFDGKSWVKLTDKDLEFENINNAALAEVNKFSKPDNRVIHQYVGCTHKPTKIVYGSGWSIMAGAKSDCKQELDKFSVVLNLTGQSAEVDDHIFPFKELRKYKKSKSLKEKEIILDWEDFGVVNLPVDFWVDIINLIEKRKGKMVVFCMGGHGRTGTALCALLMACEYGNLSKSLKLVRELYCNKAVETTSQIVYLEGLEKDLGYESDKKELAGSCAVVNTALQGHYWRS